MALPYGDYTALINNKPVPIVFERKGFSDLWGTMVGTQKELIEDDADIDLLNQKNTLPWVKFKVDDGKKYRIENNYKRFKAEMERAAADNIKLILVIEGSYTDVWNGFARSAYTGEAMLKKLATLYCKYDLEYIFCESRRVMARRIADTFLAIERNYDA